MKFGLCLCFSNLSVEEVFEIIEEISSKLRMKLNLDYYGKGNDILIYVFPPNEGPMLFYHNFKFTTIERAIELFREFYEKEVVKSVRKPDPGKRPIRYHKRIF